MGHRSHGSEPLEWASQKQSVDARSSGEAETVSLARAIQTVAGTTRGLAHAALPTLDVLEKLLGRKIALKVHVDAAVSKSAAEKGTSRQMRYLSKAQQVDLFWLRDIIKEVGIELVKVGTAVNIADMLTMPLDGQHMKVLEDSIGVHEDDQHVIGGCGRED